jgi:hypothetical protein
LHLPKGVGLLRELGRVKPPSLDQAMRTRQNPGGFLRLYRNFDTSIRRKAVTISNKTATYRVVLILHFIM